jgi:tetrapyrrole methylase family protein/MazG family protein
MAMDEIERVPVPALERVAGIMRRLLDPGGCPWDQAQDERTLKTYLLEETHELLEAIDRDDPEAMREELGDVLLQVVFQAEVARRRGRFDLDAVARTLAAKLLRRHPHVFGERRAPDVAAAHRSWERIKLEEGGGRASILDGLPPGLPALLAAYRLGQKAAGVGFDWPAVEPVRDKVDEELGELQEAMASGDREAIRAELGDVLFAICNLARHLDLDPEDALRQCNGRFRARFQYIEQKLRGEGRSAAELTPEELDALWEEAKR